MAVNKVDGASQSNEAAQRSALAQWFNSSSGQQLLFLEQQMLAPLLAPIRGKHLIQIGVTQDLSLCAASAVQHKVLLVAYQPRLIAHSMTSYLYAIPELLPLMTASVDILILHHSLAYSQHPYQSLLEAQRVLTPGGHLFIVGFNPLSSWGLWRLLRSQPASAPWDSHFISIWQLKRWLDQLNLAIQQTDFTQYNFPFAKPQQATKTLLAERWASRCLTGLGAVYGVYARKQPLAMIPLAKPWQRLTHPKQGWASVSQVDKG
jgi:SAM-dependent methyltransferase